MKINLLAYLEGRQEHGASSCDVVLPGPKESPQCERVCEDGDRYLSQVPACSRRLNPYSPAGPGGAQACVSLHHWLTVLGRYVDAELQLISELLYQYTLLAGRGAEGSFLGSPILHMSNHFPSPGLPLPTAPAPYLIGEGHTPHTETLCIFLADWYVVVGILRICCGMGSPCDLWNLHSTPWLPARLVGPSRGTHHAHPGRGNNIR